MCCENIAHNSCAHDECKHVETTWSHTNLPYPTLEFNTWLLNVFGLGHGYVRHLISRFWILALNTPGCSSLSIPQASYPVKKNLNTICNNKITVT